MQATPRLVPPTPSSPDAGTDHPVAPERPRGRFSLLAALFCLLALVILAQLLRYQLFQPVLAEEEMVIQEEPNPRGVVVDRHGIPLVVNRYYYRLTATPAHLQTAEDRDIVARQLQETIGLPYEQTIGVLNTYAGSYYAVLSEAISLEEAARIDTLKAELAKTAMVFPLQHVQTVPMTKRYYPQAELTSHLLGFVQLDRGGVTGIEEYYNEFLLKNGAGLLGKPLMPLDSLPVEVRRFIPSTVGKDLMLTIDRTVQWIIREELQRGLAQYKAVAGTIIVMEPHTGAILGLVNLPDYDPNRYELAAYETFNNPAISAQYEPGSVFKVVTMAAALDAGVITPTMIFTDTGSFTIGQRTIYNSNRGASGRVTATYALAQSLNVVTAMIAERMGPELFYRYVRLFGFDEATSVDLSGEIKGQIKTPASSQWSLADLGTNSFGQGLAVTPLQMVNAVAVIANGGALLRPYVVQARIAGDQVLYTEPEVVRRVIKPEAAAMMTQMMVEVVNSPGSNAYVPGYTVAGKSGTAQIPSPEGYVYDETIVSYVGFAPAEDPQFVVLVKMDRPDPELSLWAGETAAPVFRNVTKRLLDHFGIPPDEVRLGAVDGAGE
ncbi:MAG TPA: penicillin-binding protein 2 [Caldilineaceae bacterium]|nr:penicillin-binding protein 2 [Caldilineaceae bacterium]